ncbi:hypothetical protein FPH17_09170 [Corynebacterium godavarianum]|uniref:Uncharacterized protein n=1 Tax=Corynebacterium godavarianum TaxID=2054421 RepID=A0ABY3DZN9_9CORY|nr:CRISPR-associated protein Csx19 [Corynebacterium godavarianum]MBL7284709.1 hypothetical protein [Corynebacterium godavarianum]TSJ72808.1 hypothetical protein FPH17_09170 [Corynebacterium godavarianum]
MKNWKKQLMHNIGAAQAAEQAHAAGCEIGFVYTPEAAYFVRFDAPSAAWRRYLDGEAPATWDSVFEAVFFGNDAQLRWRHEANGVGTAYTQHASAHHSDSIEQQHLLWGSVIDGSQSPHWSLCAEPRIGTYAVPLGGLDAGQRVCLIEVTNISTDEFGNCFPGASRIDDLACATANRSETAQK